MGALAGCLTRPTRKRFRCNATAVAVARRGARLLWGRKERKKLSSPRQALLEAISGWFWGPSPTSFGARGSHCWRSSSPARGTHGFPALMSRMG
jgi:hypothetical protein